MVSVSTKPTLPRWLCENILIGTLPWHQGLCQTYSQFNHAFTLHDAYLLGTYQSSEAYGETVLCFLWDSLWLPESVRQQAKEPVFLLIKTSKTLGIAMPEGTLPKSEKRPQKILKAEHVEVDDQTVLVIDDTQNNTLTVVFSGQLSFLAIDSAQRVLNLEV